ncbi:LysE family translocator [Streptomyces sp. NBC_01381]|uniref:LysE family translocator n=1 Tax=Streptomyces sp. NBC_01381 TaxID=2903845 RepID=UPI00225A6E17|nr:LysE family translocator [Streptomyces sp. NBC_01381]MCX4669875.1 LysE family translocator [Streptomyces sp. NBC_01381]
MLTATLAFAGVAALINITPGLDTLLVLRTSVAHGKEGGFAAAFGILTGCLAWGVATAVGLTALLTASRLAYDTLRIAGACYLAWLGVSALWRARRRGPVRQKGPARQPEEPVQSEEPAAASPRSRRAAFRAGLATNLLNPKAGIFYMSLIPQFIPAGAPVFRTTLLLTAVDLVELALWYWVVSYAASSLGERIRRPSFRRRLEQFSGLAFLGFAANLALADHRA